MTDGDFSHAYMTDGWATRFLMDVFRNYTVVFLGYSHEDVMMKYLSKGLPDEGSRYAFTGEDEKTPWEQYSVTPITYPVKDSDKDHTALYAALDSWAKDISESRGKRDNRITRIVSRGADPSSEDADYLIRRLHTKEGAATFTRNAGDDENWLKWVVSNDEFDGLLALDRNDSQKPGIAVLSSWFLTSFAAKANHLEFALSLLRGKEMSQEMQSQLSGAIRMLTESEDGHEAATRLLPLVITGAPDQVLKNADTTLMQSFQRGKVPSALLDYELRPCIDNKKEKLQWRIEATTLSQQLGKLRTDLTTNSEELRLTLEGSFLSAYHLCETIRTWWEDPVTEQRVEISNEKDKRIPDTTPDVIIDTLKALGREDGQVDALAEHWWSLEYPIFRRLAVDLVANSALWEPDERIEWALRHEIVFSHQLENDTTRLLLASAPHAGERTRQRLFERIEEGLAPEEWETERLFRQRQYNLVAGLSRACPDWESIRQMRENLEREWHFQPDTIPRSTGDNTERGIVNEISSEEEFAERALQEPHRLLDESMQLPWFGEAAEGMHRFKERAFTQIAETSRNSMAAGVGLWDDAGGRDEEQEIRSSIIEGWAHSNTTEQRKEAVLRLLDHATLEKDICNVISVLIGRLRELKDAFNDDDLNEMNSYVNDLWINYAPDFSPRKANVHYYSPREEWPGMISWYWAAEVCARPYPTREGQLGFSEQELHALDYLLETGTATWKASIPVVAQFTKEFYERDPVLTKKRIFPLFGGSKGEKKRELTKIDEETMREVWRLFTFRISPKMAHAGFSAKLGNGLKYYKVSPDEFKRTQYMANIFRLVNNRDLLDSKTQQQVLASIVINTDPSLFAVVLCDMLNLDISKNVDGATRHRTWTLWLHDYVSTRFSGLPRNAEENELETLSSLPFLLDPEDMASAIGIIGDKAPGFNDQTLLVTVKALQNENVQADTETADFLKRMIRNTESNFTTIFWMEDLLKEAKACFAQKDYAAIYETAFETGFINTPEP